MSPDPMADESEYIPLMQSLIRTVVRKFYEPHHCVIMDILLEHFTLKEAEICANMHMLGKEFNRLIIKLKEDRLIRHESKIETEPDGRQLLSQCYFLNLREIKDIIKYKIFKMGKLITKNDNTDVPDVNINYTCPHCEIIFSTLEAQSHMRNFQFICPDCDTNLKEIQDKDSFELHRLMMKDLKEIIEMLKKADQFDIPLMDYFQVLELKKRTEKKSQETEQNVPVVSIHHGFDEKETFDEKSAHPLHIQTPTEENITFIKETDNKSQTRPVNSSDRNTMVMVNGVAKPLSEITTDDQEKMNEEEYEEYFRILGEQEE